jgi:hypothetical protein
MILKERFNSLAVKLWIVSQLAVLPTCKPSIGANPKTSVASDAQGPHIVAGETLTLWWLPGTCSQAIEAVQAKFRAEP